MLISGAQGGGYLGLAAHGQGFLMVGYTDRARVEVPAAGIGAP